MAERTLSKEEFENRYRRLRERMARAKLNAARYGDSGIADLRRTLA